MIEYQFQFENGEKRHFAVILDRGNASDLKDRSHPEWTLLEHHRCDNCPLAGSAVRYCPAAVDLEEIIACFSESISYEKVEVQVKSPEREYRAQCDIQKALYSLLGLVMATSGCPILNQLRPLAHYHLPFATPEETIFRTVSAYLFRQYLTELEGGQPDFKLKGLERLYEDLVIVNDCFVKRIKSASRKDGNPNALIRHDTFSILVLFAIKDCFANEKARFIVSPKLAPVSG